MPIARLISGCVQYMFVFTPSTRPSGHQLQVPEVMLVAALGRCLESSHRLLLLLTMRVPLSLAHEGSPEE